MEDVESGDGYPHWDRQMRSFLSELKRRSVFKVAVAYGVVAWLLMQVAQVVEDALALPEQFDTLVIVTLALGFPIALILAWAYDLTPEGVKREEIELRNL